MKNELDEDYMYCLRSACFTCGAYVDMRKARQMRIDGATQEEVGEWIRNEKIRLKPIQDNNFIALHGTDEEVIELAKRICPEQLESPSITVIS